MNSVDMKVSAETLEHLAKSAAEMYANWASERVHHKDGWQAIVASVLHDLGIQSPYGEND